MSIFLAFALAQVSSHTFPIVTPGPEDCAFVIYDRETKRENLCIRYNGRIVVDPSVNQDDTAKEFIAAVEWALMRVKCDQQKDQAAP